MRAYGFSHKFADSWSRHRDKITPIFSEITRVKLTLRYFSNCELARLNSVYIVKIIQSGREKFNRVCIRNFRREISFRELLHNGADDAANCSQPCQLTRLCNQTRTPRVRDTRRTPSISVYERIEFLSPLWSEIDISCTDASSGRTLLGADICESFESVLL